MTPPIKFLLIACLFPPLIILLTKRIDRYRREALRDQAGVTAIHGTAANSLQTEKMRIRKVNRDKGVIGELGVAEDLENLASEYGLTVLHDLSMPDSKANIDHVLIARKVVYVVDAKNYTGIVKVGPNRAGEKRLRVGKYDQTKLAEKLKIYADAVSEYLKSEGIQVPVVPLLAFYNATFHKDSAFSIKGVTVNVLGIENELLRYANIKSGEIDIDFVAERLLVQFPPKSN
jgi:hypothetical protein